MTKKGLVCPNAQWTLWTSDQIHAIVDLAPQTIQVLLYAETDHRPSVFEVVERCPSIVEVQFRPYNTLIPRQDPDSWARACWRRVEPYIGPLEHLSLGVIPANEMNLAGEGGHTDMARHVAWLINFGHAWGRLDIHGIFDLHLPAPSPGGPGGSEPYWRALAAESTIASLYDVVDVHCYGGASERDYDASSRYFHDRPVSITEWNGLDPEQYLASLPAYVESACYFILSGTEDMRPYWLMGSPYYDSFKRAASGGGNGGEDPVFFSLYDEWAAARVAAGQDPRDREAFAAHIVATGGDPTDLSAYGWPDFSVGPGILDVMAELGDEPASDEEWEGDIISHCQGVKNRYIYEKASGLVFVSFQLTQ